MVQTDPTNSVRTQSPADQRRDRARHDILRAASTLFRARGFHATGMRDIAAALGMTVGNLYYYFRNKQDLLAFCQRDTLSRLLGLAESAAQLPCGADQQLWLLIAGHVRCLNEGVPGSLAHLEIEALDLHDRDDIVQLRSQYERAVRELIQRGIEAGTFAATDADVAARAILGAVNWTVKWFRPDGRLSLNEISASFASQLVRGLLRPGVQLQSPDASLLAAAAREGNGGNSTA